VTSENRKAFALIEIIGVLAILVILTCLLLPQISKRVKNVARSNEAAQDARVADTLVAIQSLKAAVQGHYAQFGTLGPLAATTQNGDSYDALLLRKGFLDRPFTAKVGTHALIRILDVSGLSAAAPGNGAPGAYDLNGDGQNDIVRERYVVEAVIFGVTDADAKALNDQLDGPPLGADAQGNDLRGQVIWNGAPPHAPREVHIYIARGR
jgi:type II secretory pathway pseudopilin PulG